MKFTARNLKLTARNVIYTARNVKFTARKVKFEFVAQRGKESGDGTQNNLNPSTHSGDIDHLHKSNVNQIM